MVEESWDRSHPLGISGTAAPGAHIHFGIAIDWLLAELNNEATNEGLHVMAFDSEHDHRFDIKTGWFADFGPNTDYLPNGSYATIRSAGNYLAGMNAMTASLMSGKHMSPEFAQKLFGAYQQGG